MKKSALLLMVTLMSLTFAPTYANTGNTDPVNPKNDPAMAARADVLMDRLYEIKEMDKSELTGSEKKELRKEVRSIKSELAKSGNGVYLSIGAIIIIVLLLILLL